MILVSQGPVQMFLCSQASRIPITYVFSPQGSQGLVYKFLCPQGCSQATRFSGSSSDILMSPRTTFPESSEPYVHSWLCSRDPVPMFLCGQGCLFQKSYVPRPLDSQGPVPIFLYSQASMIPMTYVFRPQCSQGLVSRFLSSQGSSQGPVL